MAAKSFKSLEPKKSLGQNFLTDPWWIQRIVSAMGMRAEDTVLEIGPGKGVLTAQLIGLAGELIAIEIDSRMVEILKERFADAKNLRVVHEDFLKFDLSRELKGKAVRIVGNLPYHITSGIIGAVLDEVRRNITHPGEGARVTSFDIMIQKEVGDRISAPHGSKVYGVLSVLASILCDVRILLDVPPKAFSPQPKVMSSILHFAPLPAMRFPVDNWPLFHALVRAAFNQRRKMLRNSLNRPGSPVTAEQLSNLDTDMLNRRPEQISPKDFADLANTLNEVSHE